MACRLIPSSVYQACVVPRPIGWISTVTPDPSIHPHPHPHSSSSPSSTNPISNPDNAHDGDNDTNNDKNKTTVPANTANLAPYSQFQNLTFDPPYVMFSANQTPDNRPKDSAFNARTTGVFCWQLATYALRHAVNLTSEQLPFGTDEFDRAHLTKTWSRVLKTPVPMVAESPVRFECEYHDTIHLPGNPPMGSVDIVIGKVVAIHIEDDVLTNGKLDIRKTMPIARCGYYKYAVIRDTFEMTMPGDQIMRDGLEGSSRKNREYGSQREQAVDTDLSHVVGTGSS